MSELTHFNARGEAHMVDVGDKAVSHRVAITEGRIRLLPATHAMVAAGTHKKGDVLGIARVAGIMAAKRTAELIPLCHPIGLTRVAVEFELDATATATATARASGEPGADSGGTLDVLCRVTAETRSQTGVEMEALIAVQVALATVYDMCKAVDRGMVIDGVRLVEKRGGKSGVWRADDPA